MRDLSPRSHPGGWDRSWAEGTDALYKVSYGFKQPRLLGEYTPHSEGNVGVRGEGLESSDFASCSETETV